MDSNAPMPVAIRVSDEILLDEPAFCRFAADVIVKALLEARTVVIRPTRGADLASLGLLTKLLEIAEAADEFVERWDVDASASGLQAIARPRTLLGRVRPQSAPSAAGELSVAPSPVAGEGSVPATGGADTDADADHRRDFAIAQGMV